MSRKEFILYKGVHLKDDGFETKDAKIYFREHFIERLKERFNLEISEQEYDDLCKSDIRSYYPLTCRKYLGKINFKGEDIFIIKDRRYQTLNTCLNRNMELPIPRWLKRRGVSWEEFNIQINKYKNQVDFGVDWLKENKDIKKFVLENPLLLPEQLISGAISKYKNDYDNFGQIVHFIFTYLYNGKEKRSHFKRKQREKNIRRKERNAEKKLKESQI